MLTGRPVFAADTMSDTVAAVLMREPDLSALPADTPAFLRSLLKRCLERDAKLRLRDIGEAGIALAHPGEERPDRPVSRASTAPRLAIGALSAALILALIGLAATIGSNRSSPLRPGQGVMRFPILVPDGEVAAEVKISPDVSRADSAAVFSAEGYLVFLRGVDGKRFLLRQAAGPPAPPITVLVNWTEGITNR